MSSLKCSLSSLFYGKVLITLDIDIASPVCDDHQLMVFGDWVVKVMTARSIPSLCTVPGQEILANVGTTCIYLPWNTSVGHKNQ